MNKISLYANTIRYLKFEQLWYRVLKRFGFKCSLIKGHRPINNLKQIKVMPVARELDYDEEFIKRFSIDELMKNEITLLYSTEHLNLSSSWFFQNRSPLWNHNLHYFEYLFVLAKYYEDTKDDIYINKIKEYIIAWIDNNPIGIKNSAWECYPIALRIPIWIDLYSIFHIEFDSDEEFRIKFINSIFEQYIYLLHHLERHLLANHYFEDIKALIIASSFFCDSIVQKKAIDELIKQCQEQIFDDGMHYERSPMYQKILLEDLIRVEIVLEYIGKKNLKIREYIKRMLDVSYSFEYGINRIPLFNDCGSNVSKSLNALVETCKQELQIEPSIKHIFKESGYYIYESPKDWKLIIDAGQPGPDYSPGHAHCESMSFELFYKGKPLVVNCGTYAYQCEQRRLFKSTRSHNTVRTISCEQSEIWSSFRMARRARIRNVEYNSDSITIQMTDYKGNLIERNIKIDNDRIMVIDRCKNDKIDSFLHFTSMFNESDLVVERGEISKFETYYAEEFGRFENINAIKISGKNTVKYTISIKDKI